MSHTIAAVSTGNQVSAIGILRLSGEGCIEIAEKVFSRPLQTSPNRLLVLGELRDIQGRTIDQCMAVVSRAPHSYTGEDTVEFHCHGSPAVLAEGLRSLYAAGARPAQRGEFTKRAFLNGKLDLTQAEAVIDLIEAETADAAANAAGQVGGTLKRALEPIYDNLTDLCSHFHAVLDYPDEDIEDFGLNNYYGLLKKDAKQLYALLQTYSQGRILRQGVAAAIVGKPNVGKSSLINKLLGENRLIVSDIAGTTRDAVDTEITYNGKEYVFIDTAGLRRKNKIKEELERYMIVRTVSAVERAEVVVLMIDAEEGVTEQDAKIAGIAHERGKATIIVVNKWDAIEKDDKTIYKFTEKVRNTLSFMPYAELLFVSAKTGQRLPKLFETIDIVSENHAMRVATGVLNEIMAEAVAMQQPPSDKGKRLRLYYITQVAVKPPTFVIFVNDKELMHFSYTRYIENQIRETFGFKGTPLRFIIRERKEKDQ